MVGGGSICLMDFLLKIYMFVHQWVKIQVQMLTTRLQYILEKKKEHHLIKTIKYELGKVNMTKSLSFGFFFDSLCLDILL